MKKSFLLLLLMTLLPLAMWAQTVTWVSGKTTEEVPLGSSPSFPTMLNVVSGHGNHGCSFGAIATAAPSGSVNEYNYQIYASETATSPFAGEFEVGTTYYVRLFIRHENGTSYSYPYVTYGDAEVNIPFKITKGNVEVKLYAYSLNYGDAPTIADMATPGVAVVSGATDQWDLVKGYLTFEEVEGGSDVGSVWHYKLTAADNAKYNISVNTDGAEITYNAVVGKLVAPVAPAATDLVYNGDDIPLVATPAEYQHNGGTRGFDGQSAGTVEYSLDGTTWSADIPTGKNAAVYTVYYRGVADGNHIDLEDNTTYYILVEITPYPITTADINAPTGLPNNIYTGDEKVIAAAATWKATGKLKDALEAETEFWYPTSTDLTKGTNAGKYNIEYKVNLKTTNFTWTSGTVTLTDAAEILKADLEPQDQSTLVVTGLKYNAANQKLLKGEAALPEFKNVGRAGTFTYYVDGTSVGTNWEDVVGKDADVDANAYVITYTFEPTSTNFNAITTPQPIGDANIAKATVTVTGVAAREDVVYNADDQMLLKSGATVTTSYGVDLSSPADFTIEYTWPNNSVSGWKSVKGKNAGTYEINYQVTLKDLKNFVNPAAGKVTAKIGKHGLDVSAFGPHVTYGTPVVFSQLAVIDDKDWISAEPSSKEEIINQLVELKSIQGATAPAIPTNAGSYDFELQKKDVTNCNYDINAFSPNATLVIDKIDAVPASVAAVDLTYTGADQALVTVGGTAIGGTMQYFVGDAAPTDPTKWQTTIPTGLNADDYNVWTMIKGDDNHNDVVATTAIPVKIKQKNLNTATFALAPTNLVYTGADQKSKVTVTATDMNGDKNIITTEDFEETKVEYKGATVEKLINEGTYTYTFTGKKNYTGTATATITIGKKALDAKMFTLSEDKEYNGAFQKPTITAKDGEANPNPLAATDYEFEIKNSKGAVVGLDAMKNADTYTFTFKAKAGGNYKDAATAITKEWKITKKPLVKTMFTLSSYEETYDGTNLMPTFTFADGNPSILASTDFGVAKTNSKDEAVTEMVDADTYTYTFTATAAGNYSGSATRTFVIKKATAEIVEPSANVLTYNGKNQALVTEATTDAVDGQKIEYQVVQGENVLVDWTEDYAAILAKNAGDYTVKYNIYANGDNYTNPLVAKSVNVKILQANVKFRMGKQEETYTGEAFEPKEGKAYTLAAGGFFAGDEDVLTFAFEEGFDATTACEEGRPFKKLVYTFKDDIANYTVDFQNEGLLIIKKANPAEFTAPAAIDLTYNGKAQELVTKGSVAKVDDKPLGTIMFTVSKDGKGEYTTAVPQATDALKYDAQENRPAVWFKVVGDANHKDTEPAKVDNVEIKPYTLTADMIKGDDEKPLPNPYQKPYKAEVQSFPMKLMVKLAADKNPRTLADKTDYTLKINGKEVKDVEIKNAGDYVYTFTGKGNYTGTISTTAYITKGELIATAPNAVKTYDGTAVIEPEEFKCTATQLKLYGGLEISGLLADDKIDLGGKTIADIIVPEGSAINVGTYNLKVNLAAIPEQANYTFNPQTFNGKLTINKAPAVKIGFKKKETVDPFWPTQIDVTYKTYSKSYGTDDPAFITEKGTNDVTSIADDLDSLEGKFYEDKAYIASLLGATREPGQVYKEDGYTVKLNKLNTSNTAELQKIATFINNYKSVTFGTTKFFITPYEGTIKVSIKSDAVVFDGKEHADAIAWAEDLSNMVVVGMPAGKNKNEIFTELPKITVTPKDGKVRNAGDYNITFEGGKSENYDMKKVQFVLGSYLTIEPFEITPDMVEIADQQAKIGDKAKDAINHTAFTFVKPLPVVEDANLFQVVAAPDFVNNGLITVKENAKPAEGLTLALKDKPTDAEKAEAKNYIGYDEVFGYLSIIGTPNLLVLDDTKDIVTYDRENTDVTFTSRKISPDNWNVVCLPFDATIKEISDAFGYAAIDLLNKVSVDGSMHFVVTTSGTVPAGEPFIIKPTSDPELNAVDNFDQVKFTGVTVKEFSDNPEPVKDSAGNKFCGTFKAHTYFFGEKFWYMSKSEWKQASNFTEAKPVDLGAYRAYIETATAGARIFIEEPDGTITAINAIDLNNNAMDEGWYTVNGMKLNAAPTQKGTYIKDGKKVFVK